MLDPASHLTSIADWISKQTGWRRLTVAILAGAITVLALAPINLWLVPFISFPVLVWLIDGATTPPTENKPAKERTDRATSTVPRWQTAFLVGWGFGFGYFLTGLYWIGAAFLVEAEKFAWAMPFAVCLLPAGLALFFAAATDIASRFWSPGPARTVILAIALFIAEWIRGHIFTGFPWNNLGYTLTSNPALTQSAALVGVYGLGFFAILLYSLPATLVSHQKGRPHQIQRVHWVHLVFVCLFVLSAAYIGWTRVPESVAPTVGGLKLRLVQPNIPQTEKWKPERRQWIFTRYIDLSQRNENLDKDGLETTTHLIWPESALPFLLRKSEDAKKALDDILPQNTKLITGALRIEQNAIETGAEKITKTDVFNSLFVMDHQAKLISIFDKMHLVPFGEYLPFQQTLEWLGFEQLTRIRGGFKTGPGPRIVSVGQTPPFAPLICYEIIFPNAVVPPDRRPDWLLNVTNDAWFGNSLGPYQHFHQARLRAIEEGLPVIRVANTGLSAIIDPYGRIVKKTSLNQAAIIDGGLPKPLNAPFYARFALWIHFAIIVAGLIYFVALSHLTARAEPIVNEGQGS